MAEIESQNEDGNSAIRTTGRRRRTLLMSEVPLDPSAPFLASQVVAAGRTSFPDFIDQMCNYVMSLVPSMLCLNTKAAEECSDMLNQDQSDPPASLVSSFNNAKAEDSLQRGTAGAALGEYEAAFFSNFGDAKLPYLVELSATKTVAHLKSTSREGLHAAATAATSLGLKTLEKLAALETATLHLSSRQKQSLYAAKECDVLSASQMTHAEHYHSYVSLGYIWYTSHEEKATELAQKWQFVAKKLRSTGERLQRARLRVLRTAQKHVENVRHIAAFLDESAFSLKHMDKSKETAFFDTFSIPSNLTQNATLAQDILSRIIASIKGGGDSRVNKFGPVSSLGLKKGDNTDVDPLVDTSGILDSFDNLTTVLLEQRDLAEASAATREQSRRALASLIEEVSSRHHRGLAVSHIEEDDWIKLGQNGDSGPLGHSQKRIIKDMAQIMTAQIAADMPSRIVEDLQAMVEQAASGQLIFTLPKLLGRNVARMLGRSLVSTLSYTVPTIVSRLLPPYLIKPLENTLTTSMTLGITHTLSAALTYTLASTPSQRDRCNTVCSHHAAAVPQSVSHIECLKCRLIEQQNDENLKPTEWQASYYSDYYAAYFTHDENSAGGKHGDTTRLEAEIMAKEKADKPKTKK